MGGESWLNLQDAWPAPPSPPAVRPGQAAGPHAGHQLQRLTRWKASVRGSAQPATWQPADLKRRRRRFCWPASGEGDACEGPARAWGAARAACGTRARPAPSHGTPALSQACWGLPMAAWGAGDWRGGLPGLQLGPRRMRESKPVHAVITFSNGSAPLLQMDARACPTQPCIRMGIGGAPRDTAACAPGHTRPPAAGGQPALPQGGPACRGSLERLGYRPPPRLEAASRRRRLPATAGGTAAASGRGSECWDFAHKLCNKRAWAKPQEGNSSAGGVRRSAGAWCARHAPLGAAAAARPPRRWVRPREPGAPRPAPGRAWLPLLRMHCLPARQLASHGQPVSAASC